MMNFKMVTIIE